MEMAAALVIQAGRFFWDIPQRRAQSQYNLVISRM
jgi:hypothetical protein